MTALGISRLRRARTALAWPVGVALTAWDYLARTTPVHRCEIAAEAGISVGLVCRYYPTKEHVALALYDQLASELEGVLPELPVGRVVDRFEIVMRRELALL